MPRTSKTVNPAKKSASRRRPKWAADADQAPTDTESRYNSRAILRALDVLEAFDEEHVAMNLKELSGRIGLTDASLFRVLMTLLGRGYLLQSNDGTYQLAPKVLLGRLNEQADRFREHVLPELQNLASSLNETASLAYLFGDRIQVIESIESLHEIRMMNRSGRVLPPHCSAMGKAIAAFQPAQAVAQILECYGLYPRTEHSISDRGAFLKHLEKVKATGIAYDREESLIGGVCVAAAIRQGNQVLAAVSVSTPTIRMNATVEKKIVNAVQAAAMAMGKTFKP